MRFLGELDCLLLPDDKPNVCAFRDGLNRLTIRRVVHQFEKVLLCLVSAIRLPHFGVMLDVTG